MDEVVAWTLIIALVILITVTLLVSIVSGIMWSIPRLERMQKGEKSFRVGNAPCCPPGLGCNDPDKTYQSCRRQEARQGANYEESIALEGAWQEYSVIPDKRRRRKEKVAALQRFARVRDSINTRHLQEMFEKQKAMSDEGRMIGDGASKSDPLEYYENTRPSVREKQADWM